jgi:hypothetical protein
VATKQGGGDRMPALAADRRRQRESPIGRTERGCCHLDRKKLRGAAAALLVSVDQTYALWSGGMTRG